MARYVKPTLDTKFHVDFSWWEQKGQNLSAFLRSHICPECRAYLEDSQDQTFDWISLDTGEVIKIDVLWHILYSHCSQDPTFLDSRTPLTSAIFRTFIANNNTPLTPVEIHQRIAKQTPELILKTIGRRQVYNGIKPFSMSV